MKVETKEIVTKLWMLFFALQVLHNNAQTISPQVINAAGSHRQLDNSGIYVTDNVGEPFIQTANPGNMLLMQGFIQPEILSPGKFIFSSIYQSPNCIESYNDAYVSVTVEPPKAYRGNYSVKYLWTPSGVCPDNSCAKIDSLPPGLYTVRVIVTYTSNIGSTANDTIQSSSFVITKSSTPCKVVVYNGVSPNNDGVNDKWIIENITDFPNNRVTIYNRWGKQLFDTKGYNNVDKVWPQTSDLNDLNSTTYFYVIELEPGGTVLKGWVELIKNQ